MENWCTHLEKLCTHIFRKGDTFLKDSGKVGDFKTEDTAVHLTSVNELEVWFMPAMNLLLYLYLIRVPCALNILWHYYFVVLYGNSLCQYYSCKLDTLRMHYRLMQMWSLMQFTVLKSQLEVLATREKQ